MRLWELEEILDKVKPFREPKVELEQYPTDSHLAANMIYIAQTTFGDIEDKHILDLGCGCGILSIASMLMDSASNTAIDIDGDALGIFKENIQEIFDENQIEFINSDVLNFSFPHDQTFDTVLLNPPFGTKDNAGIDIKFLEKAIEFSHHSIYSMHKSSTRQHIQMKLSTNNKVKNFKVLAQMKFEIPKMYKFHTKSKVFVEVDLIRIEVKVIKDIHMY